MHSSQQLNGNALTGHHALKDATPCKYSTQPAWTENTLIGLSRMTDELSVSRLFAVYTEYPITLRSQICAFRSFSVVTTLTLTELGILPYSLQSPESQCGTAILQLVTPAIACVSITRISRLQTSLSQKAGTAPSYPTTPHRRPVHSLPLQCG